MARIFEDDRQDFIGGLAHICEDCQVVGKSPKEFFMDSFDDHCLILIGYMMAKTDYSSEDCMRVIGTLFEIDEGILWAEVEREVYNIEDANLH